jgi:hypothetical protein
MPWRAWLLRRLLEATVLALVAGLLVWTIRAALQEPDAGGVWATITAWALAGIPAVVDLHHSHRGRGPLPSRSRKWE